MGKHPEVELKFVTLEHDEVEGPICNIRALKLRCCHGNRRGYMLLCVYGVIIFTAGKKNLLLSISDKLMII